MNADLQSFVRDSLARGLPRAAIRERLLEAGWRPEEVAAALDAFAEVDFPVPVPRRRPYLSAREAFLYLVLFATLYTVAFNTGAVLFHWLDRWLPDVARSQPWSRSGQDFVRGSTASLIIAFPVFLLVGALIGRAVRRDPEKRGSKIRKWLTYVTLFVAALVVIGDLIFLVQRLLGGELPPRVLLKVLVVAGIAGALFAHYLGDLRGEEREGTVPGSAPRWPGRLAGVGVAIVVVLGLMASGSPRSARLHELDAQRIRDLRQIWSQLEKERRDGRVLPATLEGLARRPPEFGPPITLRDRVTGRPYEYRLVDSATVELCATFATADSTAPEGSGGYASEDSWWKHGRGRTCFTLPLPARPAR
jgi:hypothetical protein